MKKFILRLSAFLLLFVLMNLAYLLLVQKMDWNFKKSIEAKNISEGSFDLLVFGNSLAMDGINTEMIGNAYNFSLGGATLVTNEYQLNAYLENAAILPDQVILAMASCIDEDYSRTSVHPIIRYTNSNKFDSFYDLPIIQFKWMALELAKKIFSKAHRQAKIVQGQLRISRILPDTSSYQPSPQVKLNIEYYQKIEALQRINQLLKSKNIDLIVIEMPGIKEAQNAIPVGPHDVSDFKLYNFNNIEFCNIFDDRKHWLGGSHLNATGARVFTAELMKILE